MRILKFDFLLHLLLEMDTRWSKKIRKANSWWQLVQAAFNSKSIGRIFHFTQSFSVTNTENVRDIFSIFHDGTIAGWKGDKSSLTLKIECQYLAEKIDPTFEDFFVELTDIGKLVLVVWMNSIELEQEYFVELKDIFQAELEILSAEIENDLIKVSCNQSDTTFDYFGGTLYISCKDIKVFDQNRVELTIDRLDQICKQYWDKFAQ